MSITLRSATNASQKVLTGVRNCVAKPFRVAKLKNENMTLKPKAGKELQRVLFSNENNNKENSPSNQSKLVEGSKKIQKISKLSLQTRSSSRKVLGDITNVEKTKDDSAKKSSSKKPQVEKTFLEDVVEEPYQTANYVALNYVNTHTRRTYKFYCFHDQDLKIPAEFAVKTISHSCDNDCTTDEDQIRGAIKRLTKAIQEKLKEEQEAEETLKKH